MNPAAQLSVSLVVGLALWLPSLSATLRGDLELPTAALRYLLAFALTRIAVAWLARLVDGYARATPALAGHDARTDDDVLDLADGDEVARRRRADAAEDAA